MSKRKTAAQVETDWCSWCSFIFTDNTQTPLKREAARKAVCAYADRVEPLKAELAERESDLAALGKQAHAINVGNGKLEAQIEPLKKEIGAALAVLKPNMPESGLEDACRQVKQAAVSWEGNCEDAEAQIELLVEAFKQYADHEDGCDKLGFGEDPPCTCGYSAALATALHARGEGT